MPTEPLSEMLDRNDSIVRQQLLVNLVCPLLRELINNGTHVARGCEATAASTGHDGHEALPPILLFKQLLEMGDGVEVLLSNAFASARRQLFFLLPAIR